MSEERLDGAVLWFMFAMGLAYVLIGESGAGAAWCAAALVVIEIRKK